MQASLGLWFSVLALILVMLAIDLFAHRKEKIISIKEAAIWSSIWLALGLGFGVFIWVEFGSEFGQQYFSGFLIEKSLAVDNVFLWALIFTAFGVPRAYQHRVLFLGVLGALVFRAIFIAAGVTLISRFGWILYIFAAFLLFTGIKMFISRDKVHDPANFKIYKFISKTIRTTPKFYGHRLAVRINGAIIATPLLTVLILIEFTDIVFALDSIPAIFAITLDPFLVFTANAFAILGLRAMYFLLADLIHRFPYLKPGLAVILIWVGIKMSLHDVYKVPTSLSLGVIILVITVAVSLSLYKTRQSGRSAPEVEVPTYFPIANEDDLAKLQPIFGRSRK